MSTLHRVPRRSFLALLAAPAVAGLTAGRELAHAPGAPHLPEEAARIWQQLRRSDLASVAAGRFPDVILEGYVRAIPTTAAPTRWAVSPFRFGCTACDRPDTRSLVIADLPQRLAPPDDGFVRLAGRLAIDPLAADLPLRLEGARAV